MKTKQIAKIREAAESAKARGPRVRYSPELRRSAVKLLRSGDLTAGELAKMTGIGEATLTSWSEGASFKRMKLSTEPKSPIVGAAARLSIILPNGARIEGVSFSELQDIIEALAS